MNVLMVGGRRTGKTSVMAAIQKNIQSIFPAGELMLDMENPNSLILFRKEQEARFDDTYADVATLMPDVTQVLKKGLYVPCEILWKKRRSGY